MGFVERLHKTEAARRLGVSRKTLERKFAEWGDVDADADADADTLVRRA